MASGKRSGLLRYNFQLGEVVLCFEPDPTKARVLYDAKVGSCTDAVVTSMDSGLGVQCLSSVGAIASLSLGDVGNFNVVPPILETSQVKAKTGQDIPAYRIHFQGWNSSWDRTVAENYILKSSEENRRLMKKLAETAKCYRNNRLRKIKINDILDKAFKHKPLVFDFEADDDDDDDSDSDSSGKNSRRKSVHNGTNSKNESSDDDDDSEEDDIDVELTIPKVLREKLEEDFLMINKRNKLLRLPAEPNIVSVLEGFVKNFSINVFYGLSDRWKFVGDKNFSASLKSIPMCREVVDGIRICFDFTLPTVLLYSFEKDQFSNYMNQHCSNGQNKNLFSFSQTPNTNSYSKTTSRSTTRKYQRIKVPKLSRNGTEKSHLDNENSIDSVGPNAAELKTASPTTPTLAASPPGRPFCRRVTRQYLAETPKALHELRQRSRPCGRGRWKFKDCGFKKQNSPLKTAGRGRPPSRRGRKSLAHLNRQDLGLLGVSEETKMDSCTTVPLVSETWKPEADDVIKSECSLDMMAKSPAYNCRTFTSPMISESSSNAVTTTTITPAVSGHSGPSSHQGCTLSASIQLKTEEGVQSMSSSSGPQPHHLALFNADSSISSIPQNITFDQGWPYHNLVKEVFNTSAGQSRIDEILTWKLLSPTVYSDCPPQPSLVCGPHQLLRLFVKLPELLCKMDLPDMKLNLLVHYLDNFLEYLASRHEDLFPVSAYVDAV